MKSAKNSGITVPCNKYPALQAVWFFWVSSAVRKTDTD